jgi:hypothetical protein
MSIDRGRRFLLGKKLRLIPLDGSGRETLKPVIPESFSQLPHKPLFTLERSLSLIPGEIGFCKFRKGVSG